MSFAARSSKPEAICRAIEKSNPKSGCMPTKAEVGEKLEEIEDGLRLETLNLMAANSLKKTERPGSAARTNKHWNV